MVFQSTQTVQAKLQKREKHLRDVLRTKFDKATRSFFSWLEKS